jgi:hypothetical protein
MQYNIPSEYVTTGEVCQIFGFTDTPSNRVKIKKILILRNADQYQLKGVRGRPIDLWVREEIQSMSEIPRIEQVCPQGLRFGGHPRPDAVNLVMTGTYVNSEKHGIEGLTASQDSYNGKHEQGAQHQSP